MILMLMIFLIGSLLINACKALYDKLPWIWEVSLSRYWDRLIDFLDLIATYGLSCVCRVSLAQPRLDCISRVNLHIFGCKCYVSNNGKEKLSTFQAKADEAIFLGYSSVSKAFKVFNKSTLKMEESIHVKFSETQADFKDHSDEQLEHRLQNLLIYDDSLFVQELWEDSRSDDGNVPTLFPSWGIIFAFNIRAKTQSLTNITLIWYFHIFGCKCYVSNNGKEKLSTFQAKADEAIFLGYSSDRKSVV